ncbi:MAG: chromosomal replication initiator protein DnaA, partial [Candidatus Kuenenia stuttgartiensis]
WSYQQIGNYFGNKKHTTVIFAIKKINEELKKDDQFKSFLDILMEKIKKSRK